MLKNFILYGFSIAVLQLLIACSPAAEQAPVTDRAENKAAENVTQPAEEADLLVVAFGDSLYAGYGLEQNEGFAPELEKALKSSGRDVRVHNAGVSGDTTAAGLRRMDFVLDSLARKPDLVLLGLGGNDLLRGLKPAETRANMDAMMKKLADRNIPVMLTGMQAPSNLGAEYLSEFNNIYPDLAKKYGAELYPFFLEGLPGRSELILPDGVHPNAEGIDLIVSRISPKVDAVLAKL